MINWYVYKIANHLINKNTGHPWTVDDVPRLWREDVRKYFEEHPDEL